jgi:hypothetical protein
VLCGGEQAAIAALEFLWAPLARRVTHLGPLGAGQTAKLCNQMIVAIGVMAIAEAIKVGRENGLDVARLPEALAGGFADSLPLRIFGPRMAEQISEPKLAQIATMQKDIEAALALGLPSGEGPPADPSHGGHLSRRDRPWAWQRGADRARPADDLMPIRLSANLSTLFPDLPMAERFQAAADAGFRYVETQFPHEHTVAASGRGWPGGGGRDGADQRRRGRPIGGRVRLGVGRPGPLVESLDRVSAYAREIGCPRVHVLAGNGGGDLRGAYELAAERLSRDGLGLMIEPLNPRDRPHYAMNDFDAASDIAHSLRSLGARLQFDAYHAA